ncbi:hypothetical protein FB567DRAFT_551334 [Paraphoma chrysanthemicola]|uniref:Uncharacterized protein n=1 Tax=Paraphoma chrysanthemicola TaxID=798071 RepID=A0A8K0VW43_9PLEO|nr:hypothetical protein FB567DRAFT_551334 [Paraphoma chrysanthemicola]
MAVVPLRRDSTAALGCQPSRNVASNAALDGSAAFLATCARRSKLPHDSSGQYGTRMAGPLLALHPFQEHPRLPAVASLEPGYLFKLPLAYLALSPSQDAPLRSRVKVDLGSKTSPQTKMQLLDLPPEILGIIAHEVSCGLPVDEAWEFRLVCGRFYDMFQYEVLKHPCSKTFGRPFEQLSILNHFHYIAQESQPQRKTLGYSNKFQTLHDVVHGEGEEHRIRGYESTFIRLCVAALPRLFKVKALSDTDKNKYITSRLSRGLKTILGPSCMPWRFSSIRLRGAYYRASMTRTPTSFLAAQSSTPSSFGTQLVHLVIANLGPLTRSVTGGMARVQMFLENQGSAFPIIDAIECAISHDHIAILEQLLDVYLEIFGVPGTLQLNTWLEIAAKDAGLIVLARLLAIRPVDFKLSSKAVVDVCQTAEYDIVHHVFSTLDQDDYHTSAYAPLHVAVRSGALDTVAAMVETHKYDMNAIKRSSIMNSAASAVTALDVAIYHDFVPIIKYLANLGAHANEIPNSGMKGRVYKYVREASVRRNGGHTQLPPYGNFKAMTAHDQFVMRPRHAAWYGLKTLEAARHAPFAESVEESLDERYCGMQ